MNPAPPVTKTRSATRRRLWGGLATGLALLASTFALAGCGGGSSSTEAPNDGFPRAAEPAESPPLTARPAGVSVAVGNEPEGVAWDRAAQLVAVGVRNPAQVVFVAPRTMKVVSRVPLPAPPRHLTYDEYSGTILVPAESANELLVVRPHRVVSATKVGTHPHDADAVGENIFVADEHSDQVSLVRKGHLIRNLTTPHQPGGIAIASYRWVAVVAVAARVLRVYGVFSLEPVATLPAGVGPSHIVSGYPYTYVADTQGNRILVYYIRRHPRLLGHVAASGTPYGLATNRLTRLWVTDTATNRLTEYSIRTKLPERIASYPTLRQPNSVAVEPRTGQVFVAGRDSGRLERIATPSGRR